MYSLVSDHTVHTINLHISILMTLYGNVFKINSEKKWKQYADVCTCNFLHIYKSVYKTQTHFNAL